MCTYINIQWTFNDLSMCIICIHACMHMHNIHTYIHTYTYIVYARICTYYACLNWVLFGSLAPFRSQDARKIWRFRAALCKQADLPREEHLRRSRQADSLLRPRACRWWLKGSVVWHGLGFRVRVSWQAAQASDFWQHCEAIDMFSKPKSRSCIYRFCGLLGRPGRADKAKCCHESLAQSKMQTLAQEKSAQRTHFPCASFCPFLTKVPKRS